MYAQTIQQRRALAAGNRAKTQSAAAGHLSNIGIKAAQFLETATAAITLRNLRANLCAEIVIQRIADKGGDATAQKFGAVTARALVQNGQSAATAIEKGYAAALRFMLA